MKVRPYDKNDPRSVEEFPGYLGYQMDCDTSLGPELAALDNGVWHEYVRTLMDEDLTRELTLELPEGSLLVRVEPNDSLVHVLDQLPMIECCNDEGPPDEGPGSCALYAFYLADGTSLEDLSVTINALTRAIREDHEAVKKTLSVRS